MLWQVTTWLELKDKLMPNGRIMVNCGGIDEASVVMDETLNPETSSIDGTWVQNSTVKALSKAFPGQVGIPLLKIYFVHLIANVPAFDLSSRVLQ